MSVFAIPGKSAVIGPVLVLAAILATPGTAAAQEEGLTRFEGTFVYARSKRERTMRLEAVEGVATKINVLFRGLARRRLTEVTEPWPRIVFAMSGTALAIRRAGKIPAKLAFGGAPVKYTNRWGDRTQVRRRWANGTVVEIIGDNRSNQTNIFRLRNGGKTLTMRGCIKSRQLPSDLVFTYTYRRTD